jgi:hypothetical protein
MFKDKLILAGVAGLIGNLVDELVDFLAFFLKISDSTTPHFIASIIYSSHNLNFTQLIVGEIAHLLAGMVLGIIPLICYLWTGKKYALIKGAGIGAGMWLNHVVLIPSLVDHRIHLTLSTSSLFTELVSLTLWGMISYLIIAKYGDDIKK